MTYSSANQNNGLSTDFIDNYTVFSNIHGLKSDKYYGVFIFERKLRTLPFIIKSSFTSDYSLNENYISEKQNFNYFSKQSASLNLIYSNKKTSSQLEFFYAGDYSTIRQSLLTSKYNFLNQNTGLRAISKIKNFRFEANTSFLIQNNYSQKRLQTLIGFKFNYNTRRITYFLKGNNLLNIQEYLLIKQISNNFMVENSVESVLSGYLILGMKYQLSPKK